jgi:hypothetical protein
MIIKNLKKYFTFEVQVRREKSFFRIWFYGIKTHRFLMIEMFVDVFVLVIINQQHVSNHLFVQCLCVWMMDGIKFNLIYLILHDVLMGQIISKHWEFK